MFVSKSHTTVCYRQPECISKYYGYDNSSYEDQFNAYYAQIVSLKSKKQTELNLLLTRKNE